MGRVGFVLLQQQFFFFTEQDKKYINNFFIGAKYLSQKLYVINRLVGSSLGRAGFEPA